MELYHVLNRGVDKRTIFMEDGDRVRFVHDMFEFNDREAANNTLRRLEMNDFVSRSFRDPIIEIHGWCLMPNHYHLLLSELVEGGLTLFIRRLNIGYAKFFNDKYKRDGTLFQGRTKKIRIASDPHFLHILHYIHLNPLDLTKEKGWRNVEIKNVRAALEHLDKYRWSSYLDYCGKKNFPSVISMELFRDVFRDYGKTIRSYLKDIELSDIRALLLE
ncbi:hypothetical protein A3A39_01420 [Candidatus Kaiserbacteria bacterium RIFCSPLOWO2_01_FULL_54_13]|uniref:Transposase IS200-like domain-containing protein n=1 Tax=Candidatus Kaiserbacteria bacterium RIFCSPLOWO2_01_FULL_54_13 TaxID=1798512 RepID=A0A1F6F401_9BACT|nr:MAG: hypothetical protein A3A39_01420 [Candidatus Kaiserbacteria bacterium RIFCSPLOWO2_01_FULL_54_13]